MNKKGFTLVELILVIIIIGIISLVTIPNIMEALHASKSQNGETIEKLLLHNLELYNTDYKEDLWCLEKSDCTDVDQDGDSTNNVIVTTKNIDYADLVNMNPDIDMGECLLQNIVNDENKNASLSITKTETITTNIVDGVEKKYYDYKYAFSAKIICGTDFDSTTNTDSGAIERGEYTLKVATATQMNNERIYYKTEN